VCGGGIESSSHRFGCFWDTVEEVDLITGDGRHLVGVSRTREPDLFHGLSVSFGTHGIITRLAVRVERAPKFVHVRYLHCASLDAATGAMETLANAGAAAPTFIDGVAMSTTSSMVVVGDGCDEPPAGTPHLSLRGACPRWPAPQPPHAPLRRAVARSLST
jgi:delta24-sterol reductase